MLTWSSRAVLPPAPTPTSLMVWLPAVTVKEVVVKAL